MNLALSLNSYLCELRGNALSRYHMVERTERLRQKNTERKKEAEKLKELSKLTKYPKTYAWVRQFEKIEELSSDNILVEKLKKEHRKLKVLVEKGGNPKQIRFIKESMR